MRNLSLAKILSLAAPYSILVAFLYLFGFWGTFHLNIFEFVALSDLFQFAVYPLISSFFMVIFGVVLAEVSRSNSLPPGGGSDTVIGRFGRKHQRIFLSAYIVILIALVILVDDNNTVKWFILPAFLSFFSVPLTHVQFLIELIPNPKARGTILFLLIYSLGGAFAYGKRDASIIVNGKATYIVDIHASKIQVDTETSGPFSFVGYIAGKYVLYDNSGRRVLLVSGQSRELLVLKPNPKQI